MKKGRLLIIVIALLMIASVPVACSFAGFSRVSEELDEPAVPASEEPGEPLAGEKRGAEELMVRVHGGQVQWRYPGESWNDIMSVEELFEKYPELAKTYADGIAEDELIVFPPHRGEEKPVPTPTPTPEPKNAGKKGTTKVEATPAPAEDSAYYPPSDPGSGGDSGGGSGGGTPEPASGDGEDIGWVDVPEP